MRIISLVLVAFFALNVLFTPFALAQEPTASSSPKPRLRQEIREFRKDVKNNFQNLRASRAAAVKGKLCEVHAKVINKRADMMVQRAERSQERLGKISDAVQNYYTNKLEPEGKTVSNYESLISEINTKEEELLPLIEQLESDASSFSCDIENPKSQFELYRGDMQALIKGLQDYRKSVKDLLVAVMKVKGSPTPEAL